MTKRQSPALAERFWRPERPKKRWISKSAPNAILSIPERKRLWTRPDALTASRNWQKNPKPKKKLQRKQELPRSRLWRKKQNRKKIISPTEKSGRFFIQKNAWQSLFFFIFLDYRECRHPSETKNREEAGYANIQRSTFFVGVDQTFDQLQGSPGIIVRDKNHHRFPRKRDARSNFNLWER